MKSINPENRTSHCSSCSDGHLQLIETDPFLQKLAQDILNINAVKRLTKRLQTCQLDRQISHMNKIKASGLKSYRAKPYKMVGNKTVDENKRNTNVPSLERIAGMSTILFPRRPPSWWTLLPEYQFTAEQTRSETTGNPPEWWSLQLPDDSLYEDEMCTESEKNIDSSKNEEMAPSQQA